MVYYLTDLEMKSFIYLIKSRFSNHLTINFNKLLNLFVANMKNIQYKFIQ